MIKIIFKTIKEKVPIFIPEIKKGCWIHIEEPTTNELKFLINSLLLDKEIIKDALDPYEVPRLENEDDNIYIFSRYTNKENKNNNTSTFLIIVHQDYFITISKDKMNFLDKFFEGMVDFNSTQKNKLVLQIFLKIIGDYQRNINSIVKNIRMYNFDLKNIDNKKVIRLINYENTLNDFLGALVPTNIILNNITSGKDLKLYEDDKELIEDLTISINQLIEMCKSSMKFIANIRESYSTIMSNNLNKTIKILTSLTVILTIPTMIYSLFGMNVIIPFQSSPLAFLFIIFGTFSISLLLGVFFWFKDLF